MTQTPRVIKACVALYEKADTPDGILELSDDELRNLIKPVAHYNRKTLHIKEMCQQLIDRHSGKVPNNREKLLALQGVGRKCVDIMMNFTFDKKAIAVDSHVHRVVNRIGFMKTLTPEQTADELMQITPEKYIRHAHEYLIQLGMKVCVARSPKCYECSIANFCEYKNKQTVPKKSFLN
ncbi:endonuclease III [Chryseobacterium sp. Ch-15]|uniref:Endonuclease III n=2 Tax=Chryseobacterium muglaense TaxID=2893752 RepID=A0A9Q3YST1_9FLAO|nr:endonuclease III [Chryseobacterium muglaense]MBD3903284.1 endonuclease III [Chryseobacterium muglaense]MCC9036114.1 endonuclease III [Chryseobacterium muglaense]MCM2553310.1 endonuclease III [Chryseobacterium muglaense]